MPRGRPPKFDEEQVLDTAAALFKRDGYDGVGVAELCKETGMAMQSLYHRFGDKAGLYREALERFGKTANDPQIQALEESDDALAGVEAFVRQWKRHIGASREDGCLFTQALSRSDRSEPEAPDAVARAYTGRLRRTLTTTLRRAIEAGQLKPDTDPAVLADSLLTSAFGVAVVGRGGMPGSMIEHAIAAALAMLDQAKA
ncbi:TetR/AcrR family transcriptional regulator [Algisphaera agarilytica]|uniref:AcrR family transcriptional regulator n=1 Tax=Algisphaera agarilytica TaxID=1385975 RepID=A0A7X0LJK6_9BACT|nr:TetR/AcrR family transcriptional regulator [Algisphaera agarilytica]MBB6429465.1 AcrR family transcriptional regulator [Algisphaera agarilytica]